MTRIILFWLVSLSCLAQFDLATLRADLPNISPIINFSAVVGSEVNIFNVGVARARIPAGSRIGSEISSSGVNLTFNPPMSIRIGIDSISLREVKYDFQTGKFKLDTRLFLDLFGIRASIFESYLETILNGTLKNQLPVRMRVAGYNPWADPNFEQVITDARNMITTMPSGASTVQVRDARGSVYFRTPRAMCIPLGDPEDELYLSIRNDAQFQMSLDSTGSYTAPVLNQMHFRVYGNDRMVVGKGDSRCNMSSTTSLSIQSATLASGGRFDLRYELGVESSVSALVSLVDAGLLLSGQPPTNCIGCTRQVRLNSVRTRIDQELKDEIETGVRRFASSYQGLIPGLSLSRFFGLNPE